MEAGLTRERIAWGLMKSTANLFKGRWKIVWMEMWDQDFVDEEVPGHVTLGDKGVAIFNLAMCAALLLGQPRVAT